MSTVMIRTDRSTVAMSPAYYVNRGSPQNRSPVKGETLPTASAPIENPAVFLAARDSLPAGRFTVLQSWEGVVVSVNDAEFTAILTDRTTENSEEEVVIGIEEISEDDRKLVKPGAVFYWFIGYKDAPGEPRRRVSQIRFRRLPAWSQHDIDQAARHASELSAIFSG